MKNKKGFTLIELLAVIVILAVIMVIAVPKILDIIESSRRKAFENSANLIAKAATLKYANDFLNQGIQHRIYSFENGDYKEGSPKLNFKGEMPNSGDVLLSNTGKVALAIVSNNKKWCAKKTYSDAEAKVTDYEEGKCGLEVDDIVIGEEGKSTPTYACSNISTYKGEDLKIETPDEDGFYVNSDYKIYIDNDSNEAAIYDYTGPSSDSVDILIPKTINGVPITTISGTTFNNKQFKSVTISPNIKKINGGSFSHSIIGKINMDYAVGLIDVGGFSDVTTNSELVIACSPSATKLSNMNNYNGPKLTIENLSNLENIDSSILNIGELVIDNVGISSLPNFSSSKIGKVTLKNLENLEKIGESSQRYFSNIGLSELTIENLPNLTEICDYVFFANPDFSKLTMKNLPKLETIKDSAFSRNKLTSVDFSGMPNLKRIEANAFSYSNITTLDFTPLKDLNYIGENAFLLNDSSNTRHEYIDFSGIGKNGTIELVLNGGFNTVNKVNFTEMDDTTFINSFINSAAISGGINEVILKNSKITNINMSDLRSVKKFDIVGCNDLETIDIKANLTELNLSNLENLTSLKITSQLTQPLKLEDQQSIKFKNNPKLATLEMMGFYVENLDLSPLTALNKATLYGYYKKLRVPANITDINAPATNGLTTCIQIDGDSSRFNETFQSKFYAPRDAVDSTCTFD